MSEVHDTKIFYGVKVVKVSSSQRPESKFQYNPPDNERPYYDRLFRLAMGSPRGVEKNEQKQAAGNDNDDDTKNDDDGVISILPPCDAARFFLTSGVPSDRLRLIWNMAVAPAIPYSKGVKPPPAMTKCQFQSAVRLIQLYQNKVTALNETLSVVDDTEKVLKPVYFGSLTRSIEGLIESSLNSESLSMNDGDALAIERGQTYRTSNVKLGTDGARTIAVNRSLNGSSSALTNLTKEDGVAESRYSMSRVEEMNYREAFTRHCVTCGGRQYVYVDAAVSFFERRGVGRDVLGKVWDIVTRYPNTGKLDEHEFVVMSHLIICLTKRGLAIPDVLPMSLRNWIVGRSRRAVSDNDEDNAVVNQLMTDPMMRMESELRSLKLLVNSLRAEVRDLSEIVINRDVSSGGPIKQHTPESDAPNFDVEMYWSEKKDNLDELGIKEKTNKLKKETASPLDLSELSSNSRDRIMWTKSESSNLRKSTTGVSQHIPPVHPRTQPSSRRLTLPPQTRHTDILPVCDSFRIGANGTHKSDRPSKPGTTSILKVPTYNSTTQNQHEQKDVQLDARKKSSKAKIKVGRFIKSIRQANDDSTI